MEEIQIKRIEVDERDKARIELNMLKSQEKVLRGRITNMQKDLGKLHAQIVDLQREVDREPDSLSVTKHAVERFKSRIMDLPEGKIRSMLSCKKLFERYKKGGAGRYRLPELSHCTVVIKDCNVVTVFNRNDPDEKIQALKKYMDYWIEQRFKQVEEPNTYIMKFRVFRKKSYL